MDKIRNYFEIKAKYQKVLENGREKVVSENYIVSAVSLSDSEKVINEELEPYISGDFLAVSSKYANVSEIIFSEDGDRWFRCKVSIVSVDESAGVEKKINFPPLLVQANTVKDAYDKVQEAFKDSVSDIEIPSVAESNIVDVFVREIQVDFGEKGGDK